MSRKIRTSRKPRAKKWTVRALTAGVVAAGSLVSLAGPAQAVPEEVCDKVFGVGNVFDVDGAIIDTKHVDFGDIPHSGAGGGAPQDKARICWANDGRVAIVGRGFYDSAPVQVAGRVDFSSESLVGGAVQTLEYKAHTFFGSPGVITDREMSYVFKPTSSERIDRVKIKVFIHSPDNTQLHQVHYYPGD